MRKIQTVFVREPIRQARVSPVVTPGCEWVLAGEGEATRKYDGTCVMLDEGGQWWARREVKPGRNAPAHFVSVEHDATTGKTVGWEPAEQSSWWKWIQEALVVPPAEALAHFDVGTYELCGPKVNGNPEGFEEHTLIQHARADVLDAPRSHGELRRWLHEHDYEGVVFHHEDGRKAKIKRRDFDPPEPTS